MMQANKERPILFSAPMVRAILDDKKSQTRRVVKAAEAEYLSFVVDCGDKWGDEEGDVQFPCPYGRQGDRLWVRETFSDCGFGRVLYKASMADNNDTVFKWTPSIHMPRWASRILLEVVSVRIERLQDISAHDAIAEGVQIPSSDRGTPLLRLTGRIRPNQFSAKHPNEWTESDYARFEYAELWASINGVASWNTNPWVWVVEFKKVTP